MKRKEIQPLAPMDRDAVCVLLGICRRTFYNAQGRGDIPAPAGHVNRSPYWYRSQFEGLNVKQQPFGKGRKK